MPKSCSICGKLLRYPYPNAGIAKNMSLKKRVEYHAMWLCSKCGKKRWLAEERRCTQKNKKPRLCSIPGCEKVHKAKGFCTWHYRRDYTMKKLGLS